MALRSAPALSSRPPHARNSHARVAFNESLARRCADHRAKKAEDHGYLFYSAHSGWGNQQVALGQALRAAHAMRRTLVLPPRLGKYDGVFGDPKRSCLRREKQPQMARNALHTYRSKAASGAYEAITQVFSLAHVHAMGQRTVDFRDFDAAHPRFEHKPSAMFVNLTCGETIFWSVREFRAWSKQQPRVLLWGSWLMQAVRDWRADTGGPCATELHYRAMVLPVRGAALRTAELLATSRLAPYSSLHLRAGDASIGGEDSRATQCLGQALRWAGRRFERDAEPGARPTVFVATEAKLGTGDRAFDESGIRERFRVVGMRDLTDLATADGRRAQALVASGAQKANCSAGSFGLMLDIALCAISDRWFYTPNAMMTGNSFRTSTFSKTLMAYWVALHAQRFRPPYNSSFFRHLPADSLELGLRLGGDPRCDTVSHCRAAAKDVGRTMMQQRVESGEAAADDRQFKCVALGLGG